ncbi:MAG: cytochrome-c peroxidase [Planctomycetota bacterium]|nr:cytochrome-c peroxidase [Planctomycetota bacterium]
MPTIQRVLIAVLLAGPCHTICVAQHGAKRESTPTLPTTPFDYQQVTLPASISRDELRQSDNTPPDNPITNSGATLGRVLFYDTRLSRNDTVSCASCHDQQAAFSDSRKFSRGFNGGLTGRNSMSLANLRYANVNDQQPGFFWDERAATLEAQVLMPIQDAVEMGMTLDDLERKLRTIRYYPKLYTAAFGSADINRERTAKALAQFLRSMTSFSSKFDLAASTPTSGSKQVALSKDELQGQALFMDGLNGVAELACALCHIPPTLNMDQSHHIGLDLKSKDRGLGALGRKSNAPFTPNNDGKFKAPSLRNVALTAPYMHDGRFKTLEQVIEHYSSGVHPHPNLTLPFDASKTSGKPTSGFQFTKQQQTALVAFLKTLTDGSFVTDPRFSDPFIRPRKDP